MIAVVVVASLEALLSQMEGGYSILLIIASALSLLPHLSCCLAGMKEEGGHTKRNAASAKKTAMMTQSIAPSLLCQSRNRTFPRFRCWRLSVRTYCTRTLTSQTLFRFAGGNTHIIQSVFWQVSRGGRERETKAGLEKRSVNS